MDERPPVVSIVLPTLNARRFLDERIDSLRAQTLADREVIAVDSDSDDGTRERLAAWAADDPRVTVHRVPKGLYAAWNFGVARARGTYVHIATADDLLVPTALENMAAALDAHPECGLCDSVLTLIDERGDEIPESDPRHLPFRGHIDFPRDRAHIRRAPRDVFAHMGGKTVYTSVAQLLIRRSLFDKTGPFPEDFGPSADFLWGLRAAMAADVVFLPERLSSWRIHAGQATTGADPAAVERNFRLMARMAERALDEIGDPATRTKARRIAGLMAFKAALLPAKRRGGRWTALRCAAAAAMRHPGLSAEFAWRYARLRGATPPHARLVAAYDAMIRVRARRAASPADLAPP